jgi:hypothetical protein
MTIAAFVVHENKGYNTYILMLSKRFAKKRKKKDPQYQISFKSSRYSQR